ncbi:uncharacterized protein Pyn_36355 [Prunus yedoensis var. nudiflora]|uniref:CCHC-type domain-containing protein n=1 Tax=Prunus yedoensis var. nudiflora TaxID=2094558 RepID=A0A314YDX0_PRUYE|nr:uncharacterized protein Pyn_36355 [Prunus yedoensis var. nudiflora]
MDGGLSAILERCQLHDYEEEAIIIGDEVKRDDVQGSELCLLGQLLTSRGFNRSALSRTLTQSWRLQGRVRFIEVEENVFQVLFNGEKELKSVLEGGPWLFDDHIFLLQRWCTGLQLGSLKLTSCPFWIQFHDLPIDCRGEKTVALIGSRLGEVSKIDLGKEQNGFVRQRYIRVRVVVDTSKPLARGVMINSGGAKHWIRFKYERLPIFCARCGLLGHEARSCPTKNFGCGIQYSDDLRAVIVSKRDTHGVPESSSNFSYGSWGDGGLKFAQGGDGGGRVPVEERRVGREALNGDRYG